MNAAKDSNVQSRQGPDVWNVKEDLLSCGNLTIMFGTLDSFFLV